MGERQVRHLRHRSEAARSYGLDVVPWTANRPRDAHRLVGYGVVGVITDVPAAFARTHVSVATSARPA